MIVHGVVVANQVGEDALGRPETITIITPLEVLKGHVSGALVLHQLGGELPDGRFFKLWGRPEYEAGHEVVVFAIARPEGTIRRRSWCWASSRCSKTSTECASRYRLSSPTRPVR